MNINISLILISLPGLFFLCLKIIQSLKLKELIFKNLESSKLSHFSGNVCLIISFNLLIILIGSINNIIYYLNQSIFELIYASFIISLFGYFFLIKQKSLMDFSIYLNFENNKKYFFYIILIFIYLIFLINRNFIYWNDQDEITLYGYFTRLYAQGWLLSDNIFHEQSRFSETLFSYFFIITNDFFICRLVKLILFLGLIHLFYIIIFMCTKNKSISYIGLLLFLTIPELSYVGPFSMKVDFMSFNFEIVSLFFLLTIISNFAFLKKQNSYSISQFILWSCTFSIVAFGNKLSSANFIVLNLFFIIYFIFQKKKFFVSFFINKLFFFTFVIFILIILPQITYKIITYQNPLYPFPGPWLIFFDNPIYSKLWDNSERFNINIGHSIFNYIYSIIYFSLGFARSFYDNTIFSNFIFHPLDKGGIGWFSPISLIIFITPFLVHKSKHILILILIFLLLFFLWSSNMQYVRAFLASSTLLIIIFCIFLKNIKNKSIFLSFQIGCLSMISILLMYFVDVSIRNNPEFINMYINKYKLFEDNLVKTLDRDSWNKYIKNDIKYVFQPKLKNQRYKIHNQSSDYFNIKDIEDLNSILKNLNKVMIINNLNKFEHLQTILNYGYVVNDENYSKENNLKYSFLCYLNLNKESLNKIKKFNLNTQILFSNNKIILECAI